MGLDQYLYKIPKKEYREYIKNKNAENKNIEDTEDFDTGEQEDVCYWRKCNQIHKFFVQNVQNNKDDCNEYLVSIDILSDLIERCKKIIDVWVFNNQKINKTVREICFALLPPQSGFFFGSEYIDKYYIETLLTTIQNLSSVIESEDIEKYDIYYNSSW